VARLSKRSPVRREQHEVEPAAPRKPLERLIGAVDQEHERGALGRWAEPRLGVVEVPRNRVGHRLVVLDRGVPTARPGRGPGRDADDGEVRLLAFGEPAGEVDRGRAGATALVEDQDALRCPHDRGSP